MNRFRAFIILILVFLLSGCGPSRFFYYPNKKLYLDPKHIKIDYEMKNYESLNKKKLFALLFKTEDAEPKGIVVHFHGNFGNVSNHFLQSQYLVEYGFDVLIFDYQGYGGSEGKPSPKRTIEDGIATIRIAETLNRNPNGGVVLLGQSLGGAVAMVAMAKEPLAQAAVIEASFPSYRGMVRDVTKRSFLTWIFYPFYPFFMSKKYDPVRYLEAIAPRPLLFIHGAEDKVIPVKMSKILFEKAKDPKELWIVEGAGHTGCKSKEGDVYKKRIADFFTAALRGQVDP